MQKNKIFIQNIYGSGYGENPKYIAEEIIKRNLDYKLVWAVKPELSKNFPSSNKIKTVCYDSISAIFEETTAKIWIDNCRKRRNVRKRKSQYYIQLWHGFPLKKIEKDVEQNLSPSYVQSAKHDSTLIDLFISESKFQSQIYRTSFWYDGEIFECGSPKHSAIISPDENIKENVKKYFGIAKDKKIVLYAPTFRKNYATDVYDIDYELILDGLCKQTKNQWVFLIKLHPNISDKSINTKNSERIISANNYDDIRDLYIAADILITDYSSCMFDFSLTNKPVFLYINDYEEYIKDRGFYFDIYSLPFTCAANTAELLEKIICFDNEAYLKTLFEFFQKVGIVRDEKSAEKIIDKIIAQTQNLNARERTLKKRRFSNNSSNIQR
ncbi:MAG: CDP-glycerol glycerophosphotransferase family protein [Chitinivibrionia bacterium]|nr:CDP-glycerol glycerophosphotransferase family protein [Chitinivibrionia bacterium]